MMMAEREDLGLSLSLSSRSFDVNNNSQLNPSPPPPPPPPPSHFLFQKNPWNHVFGSSPEKSCEIFRGETRPFLKGIDVNRKPSTTATDCEEEAGISSPNSTLSSVSGKRSERDHPICEEIDLDRSCSRGISDDEDGGETSRKKLRLSKEQSAVLEESFKEHNTLNPKQKLALAKRLNLSPRQVEVWFQNRRARTKLKQTEVDCEFLKRLCENLTDENRRLQKEVHELRALKLSPHLYMHMTPPTTLTLCPSCERVALSSTTTTSTSDRPPHHHPAIPISPWASSAPPFIRALEPAPNSRP